MPAYEKLGAADEPSLAAVIKFTDPPAMATLGSTNSAGQHTLEWAVPLCSNGVCVEAGALNLYTYPGGFAGSKLALLRSVMLEIATSAPHLFDVPDPVGAFVIHALLVCNSEPSLELAFSILELQPRLALQLHVGEPFCGECCLHILCVNRQEKMACRMVEMALAALTRAEVGTFLRSQAVGVFFEAEPVCWYGESPLSYACAFGLRSLVLCLLQTGLVSLNDNVGAIMGFTPLHAATANGLRSMYDFLTSELPAEHRAHKTSLTSPGRLISFNLDGMSPLQVAYLLTYLLAYLPTYSPRSTYSLTYSRARCRSLTNLTHLPAYLPPTHSPRSTYSLTYP